MRRKGFHREVAYSRLGGVPRCEGWVIWLVPVSVRGAGVVWVRGTGFMAGGWMVGAKRGVGSCPGACFTGPWPGCGAAGLSGKA